MSFFEKILRHHPKPITEKELQDALKHGEFVFYYQPEWDLKTNKTRGVEALVRWESPKRGYVPPMEFIPLLEKTGLIHEFTTYLFNHTVPDLVKVHTVAPDLFLAVNLSICQLQEKDLISTIQKELQANNLDSKYLECELTESQELTDEILSNGVLDKLAELNIPVSIDDFGTGYSSFERLKRLNIRKLKIDLSFIRTLMEDEKNKSIVSSIIKLGHDLGFPVLAEGVETTEQQEWLRDNGCDYAQGYWFSRGLPMDQLLPFLQENMNKK
ncbi:MAG: EAL domain-containing protein [Alphaproteobacteria bacterium]|nr:EAL domain-containing protein [Alphaproteobacteria bacterium]